MGFFLRRTRTAPKAISAPTTSSAKIGSADADVPDAADMTAMPIIVEPGATDTALNQNPPNPRANPPTGLP